MGGMRNPAGVLPPAVRCAVLLMCLGSLLGPPPAWAQAPGVISGTVTDEDNRPLPGVTITLSDADGALHRSTVTDAKGRYELANLATGTYTVTAAVPGFGPAVKTQRVTGTRREVWLVMAPAELRETLPMPAQPPGRIVPLSLNRDPKSIADPREGSAAFDA